MTGNDAAESEDSDEEAFASKPSQQKGKKKVEFTTVEFGDDDLQNFNAEKSKLIKEKDMMETGEKDKSEEAKLLKSLFVTQEEDAYEEFEKDKDVQIETQIGKSVKKTTIRQGWGSWAGEGIDNSQNEAKQKRLDVSRQRKIDELK